MNRPSSLQEVISPRRTRSSRSIEFNDCSKTIINCALEVHRALGPGLLESAYEQCLAYELSKSNLEFKLQYPLPLKYKDIRLDAGYKIDLLVNNSVILELKAVDQLLKIHEAQLLTYMKLSNIRVGLLINFNSILLKDGIKRFVL